MAAKINVTFSKTGEMRFISHLDLMRLFQRASRRADLPITMTKGFSPHQKMSLSSALKLGAVSEGEEAVFYMDRDMDPGNFTDLMNKNLPEGIRILKAKGVKIDNA